jgi:hypothetical protein
MNELFYFAFADLMARVEYDKAANALRYATHRKITAGERMIVEQYLLTSVAQKTDYYKRNTSQFVYLGPEAKLVKYLERFQLQNGLEKESDVTASVENLINQSMQNFYFEQIGDTILTMRQELRGGVTPTRVAPLRRKMEELVEAYNHYSDQQLSVAEVIPFELQSHFGLPVSRRKSAAVFSEDHLD